MKKARQTIIISRKAVTCLILLATVFLTACSSDDDGASSHSAKVKTLNVVVLMESGEQKRWEHTAQWAMENIRKAQQGMDEQVDLKLTFKSQDDDDISDYMRQIAEDETVDAIVGPTTSDKATLMATELGKQKNKKPMISPQATRVEYQRQFASADYVWNMAESDIAQMEVLLSCVASGYMSKHYPVTLLAPDDGNDSSNDYAEWFGFIAEEYGLTVKDIMLYKTADDVRRYARQLFGSDHKLQHPLIFCPTDDEIVLALDEEAGKIEQEVKAERKYFYQPNIYCTDAFVSEKVAAEAVNMTYEGVDLCAAPESGFNIAYRQRFGDEPVNGEAQFYDALCLVAYAATRQSYSGQSLNDAVRDVVDGRDGTVVSWLPGDMAYNFLSLSQGGTPDIDGVSGSWTFDSFTHASVVESTFRRWNLYNGKFLTLEYVSTNGSRHSTSSKNIWDWTASRMQSFSQSDGSDITYPELRDRWALLIAASKGWKNYRFQADVFAMYQRLRQHGYDDEHIILICEDDIAYNLNNQDQGVLRIKEGGGNVYNQAAVDYRLSEISPNDIGDILQGHQSERLPEVIRPSDSNNIFVFWSGHGTPGLLDFGDSQTMTYSHVKDILASTRHRKMLFAVESCYSGGLGEACVGIPGILFITAASPYETSHADKWSEQIGVYLSNGFTHGFSEAIDNNHDISLRDLYYNVARNTSGSHVKVYNTRCFGSMYSNTMSEFLH